jgi:hypothetical protein
MRKVFVVSVLLFAALNTSAQHRKTTKPKAKSTPTPATKAHWEQYTPCGVFYKDIDDFVSDLRKDGVLLAKLKPTIYGTTPTDKDAVTTEFLKHG